MPTTYPTPVTLSPSRVEAFTNCPLAFRFSSIEKLPEPPSAHATKGSLVHRALELLFTHPPSERGAPLAEASLATAIDEYRSLDEFTLLALDRAAEEAFFADAAVLVANYLEMEDPRQVRDIGIELYLSAPVGELTLRGIIDRLELDADGNLIVTDYKTGRAPSANYEHGKLGGVHFYSFLCEELFGRRPAAIRLMYLRSRETITATPTERSVRFVSQRAQAVWKAVERACASGDFRPRQSLLCGSCAFQPWCPQFGGDPALAAAEAPVRFGYAT